MFGGAPVVLLLASYTLFATLFTSFSYQAAVKGKEALGKKMDDEDSPLTVSK